jgi:hypothetical protein
MKVIRIAPNANTAVEPHSVFLVTLTRNKESQDIFKLNSLHHINIKVDLYRALIGLTHCYNYQNFVLSDQLQATSSMIVVR